MILDSKKQAFYAFMLEREAVRLRKESGQPRPWTDDPILQEYKFTNVRRHHDWTSAQLREHFYEPNFDAPQADILMNCALARYFGTFEFMEAIGWQTYDDFDFDAIEDCATNRLERRMRVFTGAYVITNQGISAPKQEVVVHYFLKDLHAAVPNLLDVVQMTRSWRKLADSMRKINGFGGTGFMTKEVLLDTTYTGFWNAGDDVTFIIGPNKRFTVPKDWWTWTPIGPGARRGIQRLLGHDDPKTAPNVSEVDCLDHIIDLKDCQSELWNIEEFGALSPTDIQFQLCEFDKYERVRLGQGRPRSRYRPRA